MSHENLERVMAVLAASGLLILAAGACGGGNDATGPSEDVGPAPSASRVTPSEGTVGTEVKVIGTHFRQGAGVQFGDATSDSVDVVADTLLFALAPSAPRTPSPPPSPRWRRSSSS